MEGAGIGKGCVGSAGQRKPHTATAALIGNGAFPPRADLPLERHEGRERGNLRQAAAKAERPLFSGKATFAGGPGMTA